MVEVLVSAAAEVILEKAFSLAANEIAITWGFAENLKIFHGKIKMIWARLRDVEHREVTEGVTEWLKQLKDVVREADELLDEVQYEVLRHERNGS
ncbi:CC-NBS-LRR resistance protein [Tanacetum coccineum]